MSTIDNRPFYFSQIRVDPRNPDRIYRLAVDMQFSDDGGHTWSAERFGSAGKAGEYGTRVKWNRLGSTARGQGEDRIWRLSTDDQFAVAMTGAYQG